MCSTLARLREALRSFAARFDASVLSGDDAARVVEVAGAIENMAAAVKALAAARVAECGVWREAATAAWRTTWPGGAPRRFRPRRGCLPRPGAWAASPRLPPQPWAVGRRPARRRPSRGP